MKQQLRRLIVGESMGKEEVVFLVLVGMRGNFEGTRNRWMIPRRGKKVMRGRCRL